MERQNASSTRSERFYRANQLYHYQQYCCFLFLHGQPTLVLLRLVLFAASDSKVFKARRRDYRWKPRSLQTVLNERGASKRDFHDTKLPKVSPSIHDSVDRHTRATPEAKFRSFLPKAGSRESNLQLKDACTALCLALFFSIFRTIGGHGQSFHVADVRG